MLSQPVTSWDPPRDGGGPPAGADGAARGPAWRCGSERAVRAAVAVGVGGSGEGAELGQAGLCGRTGLLKMPRLDLVFAEVTEKNVEQLRLMNELIFPVRYNDQFYKDAYKNLKLAQFGAPTRVDLPAPPTFAARARGAQRQR